MGDLKLTSASGSVTLSPENVAGTTTITLPSSTATLATNENFTSTGIDDNATSTAITIDSSENVGIGTSSPSAKLHVAGETRIYPTSGTANLRFGENTTEKGKLAVDNTSNMVFETANAERMRIDSSGNVGIGVTPEAWQSTRNTLQIGAGAVHSNGTGVGSDVDITQNAYFDGSWKYINTDEASRHYQHSGTHTFDVASSGTADTAITWTTAMTIDNSGNIQTGVIKQGAPSTAGNLIAKATKSSSGTIQFTLSNYQQASLWRHGYIKITVAGQSTGTVNPVTAWYLYGSGILNQAFPSLRQLEDSGGETGSFTISMSSGVLSIAHSYSKVIATIEYGHVDGHVNIT